MVGSRYERREVVRMNKHGQLKTLATGGQARRHGASKPNKARPHFMNEFNPEICGRTKLRVWMASAEMHCALHRQLGGGSTGGRKQVNSRDNVLHVRAAKLQVIMKTHTRQRKVSSHQRPFWGCAISSPPAASLAGTAQTFRSKVEVFSQTCKEVIATRRCPARAL